MSYLQGTTVDRTVYLTLADVPATGIPYTAVTAQIKKQGAGAYTAWPVTNANWIELGDGQYSIVFAPADTNTVGDFTYSLSSIYFDNFVYDEFTIEPQPPSYQPGPLPQQCIISGNIANLSAVPPSREPLKIVARLAQFPAKYASTLLAADAVWTFADALGNFSLALVQNSVVIIEINRLGIRSAQITVPQTTSANLIDLLPPFVVDYSL